MQPNTLSRRLNNVMQRAVDENKIVGSVVIVAKQGQIVYQQAKGYLNRENNIKMAENSIFLLSSVSKPIAIVAALLLIETGQLDLNAPITHYLSDFTPRLADGTPAMITLHQLLTHTAGLSYRFNEAYGQGPYNTLQVSDGFDHIAISLDENLRRLSLTPLLYKPGTSWTYSLSIDVLGAILMAVTRQDLDTLIRSLITVPLAMHDTGFVVTDITRLTTHYYDAMPIPQPMQADYQMQLGNDWNHAIFDYSPKRIFNHNAYHSAGAGMVGSAPDFMRFLLAISSQVNALSSNKLINKMAKMHVSDEIQAQGPGWGFGYGGAVLNNPELAHSPQAKGTIQWGGVYGHNWFYDPAQDLAVVTLTNTAIEGMSGDYPLQIRNAVYGV